MGRKSSIKKLDPRIREAVDAAIRDGRATIDELVNVIEQLGGAASRSAVGRYKKNAERQMQRMREAREMAKVWVGQLGDDPDSDVGRLLSEMLRTVAHQTIGEFTVGEKAADPKDIMFLGKAIKELAQADKVSADRELMIRKEVAKKAAATVEQAATAAGYSAETISGIKKEILGIA